LLQERRVRRAYCSSLCDADRRHVGGAVLLSDPHQGAPSARVLRPQSGRLRPEPSQEVLSQSQGSHTKQ